MDDLIHRYCNILTLGTFNGDVSAWDVSSVTDMNSMFSCATAFNQALAEWGVQRNQHECHVLQRGILKSSLGYVGCVQRHFYGQHVLECDCL